MIDSTLSVVRLKKNKSLLTSDQRKFNRLKAKIKQLQDQQLVIVDNLDKGLQFFYEKIEPEDEVLFQAYTERIRLVYQMYHARKKIAKKDRELLKEWMQAETENVCGFFDFDQLPPDIAAIYKEFHTISYEENLSAEADDFKQRIVQSLKASGLDIDVDAFDFDPTASRQEIQARVFRIIAQAKEQQAGTQQASDTVKEPERKKTKKQLEKEEKERLFQEMQAKSISAIYKNLVKALHPDLERDEKERLKKEELMKRLTCAYEKNDLFGILTLEMEWMNQSAATDQMLLKNSERLKIYNSILQEQVEEIEQANYMLAFAPKYAPIARFFHDPLSCLTALAREHKKIQKEVGQMQALVRDLGSEMADKLFDDLIVLLRQRASKKNAAPCCIFC